MYIQPEGLHGSIPPTSDEQAQDYRRDGSLSIPIDTHNHALLSVITRLHRKFVVGGAEFRGCRNFIAGHRFCDVEMIHLYAVNTKHATTRIAGRDHRRSAIKITIPVGNKTRSTQTSPQASHTFSGCPFERTRTGIRAVPRTTTVMQ
jgi:hypothetical protein